MNFWILFNLCIVLLLAADLFFIHPRSTRVNMREALWMSAFWILLSLLFNVYIYFYFGSPAALNFLTAYLIEKALSVDNLFIFALIFAYFKVPKEQTHTVLTWGVLGAILMRALFIFAGIALLKKFHPLFYIFGGFLIWTGLKLAFQKEREFKPETLLALRLLRRWMPVTMQYHADHFFVRLNGVLTATPLFVVLLAIETTDLLFALDSIPAVLGITTDTFIVYTSNILAILGLRSLYFVLEEALAIFHYLNYALALILVFIGAKMLLAEWVEIPILWSLGVVMVTLGAALAASLLYPKKGKVP
jgi:tellurite resistance protein TerC